LLDVKVLFWSMLSIYFNSTKVQILTQKALQVLPKGTVQFEQVSEKRLKGLVHELAGDGLHGSANQVVS
jgi:hypothetical protein